MLRFLPRKANLSKRLISTASSGPRKKATFFVNGTKHVVTDFDPSLTVLDYLRSKQLTGTKLTCGEGGCGACCVSVAHWDHKLQKVVYRPVNTCLMPIYSADGTDITTVEGVGTEKTGLHPIQTSLATNFGSQCGFCTPGFVAALYSTLQNDPNSSREHLFEAVSSSLCRCTGYRAIVSAIESAHMELPLILTPCSEIADDAASGNKSMKAKYEFPEELKHKNEPVQIEGSRSMWHAPQTLEDIVSLKSQYPEAKIVCGNTEIGIEQRFGKRDYPVLVSPTQVDDLNVLELKDSRLIIGSATPLTDIAIQLEEWKNTISKDRPQVLQAIIDQLKWFSGPSIRNVASIGGNIMTASPISDLNPVFVAMNALFKFQSVDGVREIPAQEFFLGYRKTAAKPNEILVSVSVPLEGPNQHVHAFKQCRRREDDIAIVTAAMNLKLGPSNSIENASLAFGGMAVTTVCAKKTEAFLKGKTYSTELMGEALKVLSEELKLPSNVPGGMPEYRTTLAASFFYKFTIIVGSRVLPNPPAELASAPSILEGTYPKGKREILNPSLAPQPVGQPIIHSSSLRQVTGEAVYTDDISRRPNELVGKLVVSSKPHAKIVSIDATEALKVPGVVGFYTAKDIPGVNKIGDIIQDEEVFASEYVTTAGQGIGIVVAEDAYHASKAAGLVKVTYEELPAILSLEQAVEEDSLFPLWADKLERGDIEEGFKNSDYILEDKIKIGGQEHFYFEPQVSLVEPTDLEFKVFTSSQNLKYTQISVATVLGLDCNRITASCKRLGGGFGGKETWNVVFSCQAAIAAHHTGRPVRLLLERDEDMRWTGHRHPFLAKYKIGFTKEGLIQALDVFFYNNGGNTYDLSGSVVNRAQFHADNAYYIPNMRTQGRIAKTNTISNTAFRGFGGPQGMIVAESWIDRVAHHLNLTPHEVRSKNMYKYGQTTHFKMRVVTRFEEMWERCKQKFNFDAKIAERDAFNAANRFKKQGVAIVPAKFGIAFVSFLNQGTAQVNIYKDGSVLITHGGVEMGQGLHTKCIQIAAASLGVPIDKVYISETSTDKIPNSSPTAASVGSDIYGMAVLKACEELNARLAPYKEKDPTASFVSWIKHAWLDRVSLSALGFHKMPISGWDFEKGQGQIYHYFTTGVAASQVVVDTLTGDHRILATEIVIDVGKSINPMIDVGQIEGAFVQGYGWFTLEELVWGDEEHPWLKPGHMLTAGPGNYKIPSIDDIPREFNVTLMEASDNSPAVHSSRGVGEPPLLLSASVVFAIRDAIKAKRVESGFKDYFKIHLPITAEKIRMACPDEITAITLGENQEHFQARGSW